jgi:hypothetical protein
MEIALGDLLSTAKRQLTTQGGWRKIVSSFSAPSTGSDPANPGNIITKAINWVAGGVWKLVTWAAGKVWDWIKSAVSWSWATAVQWVQQTFNYLWYFDWNATDESLDAQIKSQYDALLTQAGGALGQAMGWLVGGLAPGAIMFMFNEPLGVYVLNHVGEEALEEILPVFGNLIKSTLRVWTRQAITNTYKFFRQKVIGAYEFKGYTNEQIDAAAKKAVTDGKYSQQEADDWANSTKRIRDAAEKGGERKPWSFHSQFEQWRKDNIPEFLQNAAEEFVDEFSEAFWEGMMCVGSAVDSYAALQRETRPAVLGSQQGVHITFNRSLATGSTPIPAPSPSPTPTP